MAGRPTALTEDLASKIIELVRSGNFRATALRAVGLSKNVIRNWEILGEEGKQPYADFAERLQEAEAISETELVARIRNASPAIVGAQGPDLWQAALALLERRFGDRWCMRVNQHKRETEDAILGKLRAHPKLHAEVANVLAAEEASATGTGASH